MSNPLERIPPYHVHRDFLPEAERAALLDWAMANAKVFDAAGVGRRERVNRTIRNALNVREKIKRPWRRPLEARLIEKVPEWSEALGVGPCTVSAVEFDLIAYNDGAYYRRHSDLQQARRADPAVIDLPGDRLITAVYYFHNEPKHFTGGALRLYPVARPPEGQPEHADIQPEQNSLAVFPSWAQHEVLPVSCPSGDFRDSRFAVNCWIRRARPGQ